MRTTLARGDLERLLQNGEHEGLDWKREFPAVLSQGNRHPEWDKTRATILKDIVAIANGQSAGPGFLVYGVDDLGVSRDVVGVSRSWDDAMFQAWAETVFEPTPRFEYVEIAWTETQRVGIFRIERVANYPHVCKANLGGVLFDGQVWFRRGTKNTVARFSELTEMFRGVEPYKIGRPSADGSEVAPLLKHYGSIGREVAFVAFDQRDVKLSAGFEIAYWPGTRREVWYGAVGSRYEHLAMLKPVKST